MIFYQLDNPRHNRDKGDEEPWSPPRPTISYYHSDLTMEDRIISRLDGKKKKPEREIFIEDSSLRSVVRTVV